MDHCTICLDPLSLTSSTHLYVFITSPYLPLVKEGKGKFSNKAFNKHTLHAVAQIPTLFYLSFQSNEVLKLKDKRK